MAWAQANNQPALTSDIAGNPLASQPISAEEKKDIAELLRVTGALEITKAYSESFIARISARLKKTHPEMPASTFDTARDEVNKVIADALNAKDGLTDLYAQMYHKHFTHEEIKQLIAVYTNPAALKMQAIAPVLAQDAEAAGRRFGEMLNPLIEKNVRERLRKSGVEM